MSKHFLQLKENKSKIIVFGPPKSIPSLQNILLAPCLQLSNVQLKPGYLIVPDASSVYCFLISYCTPPPETPPGFGLATQQLNSSQIPVEEQRHTCLRQAQSFHTGPERVEFVLCSLIYRLGLVGLG